MAVTPAAIERRAVDATRYEESEHAAGDTGRHLFHY